MRMVNGRKWLYPFTYRRCYKQRFLAKGVNEFVVNYNFKTKEIKVDNGDVTFFTPLGVGSKPTSSDNMCFTKLDGKTIIKPRMVYKGEFEWILLIPVKVEPNKDCGFYIYYDKDEKRSNK